MKKIITCLLAALGLGSACGQQNYENADVKGFSKLIEDQGVVLLDVPPFLRDFPLAGIKKSLLLCTVNH